MYLPKQTSSLFMDKELQQSVLAHSLLQLCPVGLLHLAERRSHFLGCQAHHSTSGLDWNGIHLDEESIDEGQHLQLQCGGGFYVAGDDFGKQPPPVNTVSVYGADFKFEKKIAVDIGRPTRYGVQTLNEFEGRLLAAFYAKSGSVFLTVPELKTAEVFPMSASVGFAFVPPELSGGRKLVLIARNTGTRGAYGAKLLVREWKDGKLLDAELAKAE